MKKLLFYIFIALLSANSSVAQSNIYLRKGNRIVFHNYNGKGHEVNFKETYVDSIRMTNNDTASYFSSRIYVVLGKRNPVRGKYNSELRIGAKKDDTGFYLNYAAIASGEDDNASRTITVNVLEDEFLFYPKEMNVGQTIGNDIEVTADVFYRQSDWSANNSAQVQGRTFGKPDTRSFKTYVRITNRKVTGTEKIDVAQKSVDCFVIEYTVESGEKKDSKYKYEARVKEWYSPTYGLLKIEKYNEKNKLEVSSTAEAL